MRLHWFYTSAVTYDVLYTSIFDIHRDPGKIDPSLNCNPNETTTCRDNDDAIVDYNDGEEGDKRGPWEKRWQTCQANCYIW